MPMKQHLTSIFNKTIHNSAEKTADAIKLLKFHTKKDKFTLSQIKGLLARKDFRKVSSRLKQGKVSIKIERKGYSFLISGQDLLPIIVSKELNYLNQIINSKFMSQRFKEFSERAWDVLPEFISPKMVTSKLAKRLVGLSLFAPNARVNLVCKQLSTQRLLEYAKFLGKTNALISKKKVSGFLNVNIEEPKLGEFGKLANKKSKVVYLKRGDIEFLEQYILAGNKIQVETPKDCKLNKTRLELAKASARIELRCKVEQKDLDRIKQLNL